MVVVGVIHDHVNKFLVQNKPLASHLPITGKESTRISTSDHNWMKLNTSIIRIMTLRQGCHDLGHLSLRRRPELIEVKLLTGVAVCTKHSTVGLRIMIMNGEFPGMGV